MEKPNETWFNNQRRIYLNGFLPFAIAGDLQVSLDTMYASSFHTSASVKYIFVVLFLKCGFTICVYCIFRINIIVK